MSVLVDAHTRVVVQGITGREGSFHARACRAYGTNIVAGVTPGKGGQLFDDSIPVFDSVEEAVAQTAANLSLIFVPPPFAPDAIVEAADAGVSPGRLHHRGRPGTGLGACWPLPGNQAGASAGPQLPRPDQSRGALQGGNNAGSHPPPRQSGRGFPQRHPDLRSSGPADRGGHRPVQLCGNRRRSHRRHQLRRRSSPCSIRTRKRSWWCSSARLAGPRSRRRLPT